MTSICLNMIVKNEAHVIKRCLDSVKEHISSWVICDTGSTDATQEVIWAALQDIPGELREHEWKDFGSNRNMALHATQARADAEYILIIDADEQLSVADASVFDDLDLDAYTIPYRDHGTTFNAMRLLRASLPWRWEGVIHEYMACEVPTRTGVLAGVSMTTTQDGARSQDPQKMERDLHVLLQAVRDEPLSPRYWFYLAQTLQTLQRVDEAIDAYKQRCRLEGGNQDEVWFSRYQIARLTLYQGDWLGAVSAFLAAYATNSGHAEPLYWLGRAYMNRREYKEALPLLELAAHKEKPAGAYIVEDVIYDYEAWLYCGMCCVALGRMDDANAILGLLMDTEGVPPDRLQELHSMLVGGL